MLVLRGRRPLRLGRRRLARCEERRPLGGAGADPPGRPGPHGRLRQDHRPGPRPAARLGLAVQGKAVPGRDQMARHHSQFLSVSLRSAPLNRLHCLRAEPETFLLGDLGVQCRPRRVSLGGSVLFAHGPSRSTCLGSCRSTPGMSCHARPAPPGVGHALVRQRWPGPAGRQGAWQEARRRRRPT